MKYTLYGIVLAISILMLLPGCLTSQSLQRIDELTKQICGLQDQMEDKIEKAHAGSLTTGEALDFIALAQAEVKSARDELRTIKEKENIGWTEIIGAVLASLLGTTGVIRAWRGPTHRSISPALVK